MEHRFWKGSTSGGRAPPKTTGVDGVASNAERIERKLTHDFEGAVAGDELEHRCLDDPTHRARWNVDTWVDFCPTCGKKRDLPETAHALGVASAATASPTHFGTLDDESLDHANVELPGIQVTERPLREVTADAIDALVAANDPPVLFRRLGGLARVRADEDERPLIEPATAAIVRSRLARVADCFRGGKRPVPVAPPKELVDDILAVGSWPFPTLEAVTEVPVLRADGSVLAQPGYDARTRLVYEPRRGLKLPRIPDAPTAAETRAATDVLLDIVADFPFVNDASKHNGLGLLITPIVRPAIPGQVPLALIDKPKRGTGASLFAQMVTAVAFGRVTELTTAPTDDEEWRKKITAALLSGTMVMFFDNVEHQLSSPSLAAALTAAEWTDRILGTSEMARSLPQRATWIATGNNLRLGGDLQRRSYWIRMDAAVARPWQREGFRHEDLLAYVLGNRAMILAAILTLARAWFAAGCPRATVPKLGGFDGWATTVGSILAHAGIGDFLTNLDALYAEVDEEEVAWDGFLAVWWATYADRVLTVADLVADLRGATVLRKALPGDLGEVLAQEARSGSSFAKRLGIALGKHADAVFGVYRLQKLPREGNTTRWRVIQVPRARDVRDVGDVSHTPREVSNSKSISTSAQPAGGITSLSSLSSPAPAECTIPKLPAPAESRFRLTAPIVPEPEEPDHVIVRAVNIFGAQIRDPRFRRVA